MNNFWSIRIISNQEENMRSHLTHQWSYQVIFCWTFINCVYYVLFPLDNYWDDLKQVASAIKFYARFLIFWCYISWLAFLRRHMTYIRRSEDVQDVFWTSYVHSIYVLYLQGWNELKLCQHRFRNGMLFCVTL